MPDSKRKIPIDEGRAQQVYLLVVGVSLAIVLVGLLVGLDFGVRDILREAEGGVLPAGGGSAGLAESVRRLVVGMGFAAAFGFFLVLGMAAAFYHGLRSRLEAERESHSRSAVLDALTGVFNKAGIEERLEEELLRARRTRGSFVCAVADIDNLGRINEDFGHADGDAVIKGVGAVLKDRLRSYDVIGLYSGEEFVILFPGLDADEGKIACERLREAVERQAGDRSGLDFLTLTASFGFAALAPEDQSGEQLLRRAKAALRRAKEEGRNRCEG
jgi:diguanylate cyclase (GGDEF)-like protein